jgi:hypothetical protein
MPSVKDKDGGLGCSCSDVGDIDDADATAGDRGDGSERADWGAAGNTLKNAANGDAVDCGRPRRSWSDGGMNSGSG